ncbi:endonuclease domain-containing protein [Mycobacterium sp. IDR2000157661]|uniref:endonuclease domain-containing protein n=1 Tax=Mycobacterium sp. IDR2000157661 TaxID=2867005 RepID=UPI001EEDF894|nr:hypothetical protein [Mycobacterium sp. IDR2000157661]ULE34980.1 hypothetical protein K3G64_10660 [Mycobacterium sp. IDR2000157661]
MGEVFLGREALADGITRHELRRWYRTIFRGVYIPKSTTPTLYDRAVGAWLASNRRGVLSGVVASALHGAKFVDADHPIDIIDHERRRQRGLVIHMDRIADDEVTSVSGLPLTTPARTAFDLGRLLARHDALARLDALMRARPFQEDDVAKLLHRYGPARGVRQLRELLPLVDVGAQSPRESWLRLLLIDARFPVPETQIPVLDGGFPIAYLDMGWRQLRLGVEYDGDQHRTDRGQYVKDIRRIRMLEERDWRIVRVVAEDRPTEVIARVRAEFTRRSARRAQMDELAGSSSDFAA